ncbi:hypothetical protein FKM82_003547 [Ascaphus truei]
MCFLHARSICVTQNQHQRKALRPLIFLALPSGKAVTELCLLKGSVVGHTGRSLRVTTRGYVKVLHTTVVQLE